MNVTTVGSGRRTALLPASTKVVELGESVSTATAGRFLERLGAQVTRALPTGTASELDELVPRIGSGDTECSATTVWLNADKTLVAPDLATEDGVAELDELVRNADIVLIAGRSDEWAESGYPIDHIRDTAPGSAVIGQITHWGDSGPYADRRGGELQIQAASGFMNVIGVYEREPVKVGGHPIQATTGLLALDAVMIALFRRQSTGEGAFFTTSDFESGAYVEWKIAAQVQHGRRRELRGEEYGGPMAVATKDGHFAPFFVAPDWPNVKKVFTDPRLEEERFATPALRQANSAELNAIFREFAAPRAKKELYQQMQQHSIAAGHVATTKDLLESPQYQARQAFQTVNPGGGKIPDAPWQVFTSADLTEDGSLA